MMRRRRAIPPRKLMLIIFTVLLPINFLVLILIGWYDEGAMPYGPSVTVSKAAANVLLFPLHGIEGFFHKEIFTGALFFIGDIICLMGWSVLFFYCYKLFKKIRRKASVKKHS
ncbi:hypothetical protein [uncultured Mucilaginibacter sp.]|uniref:hypothetical protein n=1 Tax=uncultured Mucilaginibacter sp. TaxID=797541 RepID=UPI0025FCF5E1|nr:hypothetical protein [uncultured Mucilaginibacter sp.]